MATEQRLIFLDDLMKFPIRINHYDKEHGNEHFVLGIESVLEYAEQLPTIEARPVVHGRCDFCKDGKSFLGQTLMLANDGNWYTINYCPNCGAKMDGGNADGICKEN